MICPWDFLEPGTVQFCEERLCAWIREPANTWSNIGYLLTSIAIWKKSQSSWNDPIALISFFLFIGSSLFHASGTFIGEYIDVFSMFLLALFMLSMTLIRALGWSRVQAKLFYLGSVSLSGLLLVIFKPIGIALFAFQATVLVLLEIKLGLKNKREQKTDYTFWKRALSLFAAAFFVWNLDFHKIICDPHNHVFNGHAAWHLLNALVIYYLYRFYRNFPDYELFKKEA